MLIKLKINEKSFPNKTIFKDTSLEINEKDFVVIYGESGIGKSTLLNMIGLINDFEGEYYFNDILIEKKNREQTRINNFSYLFQDPYLIPYLSVYDNIVLPLKNMKADVDKEEIMGICKRLKIDELIERKPNKLSGGEAIRVSIARSIAANKRIIVVDEPTGNLDSDNAESVMNILKEENSKGKTIIMVSHSKEFEKFFNRIIKIENKKIIC